MFPLSLTSGSQSVFSSVCPVVKENGREGEWGEREAEGNVGEGVEGRRYMEQMGMDREAVFQLAKRKYGTDPEYPWKDRNAVLRHRENQKWYGVILEVGREKLGIGGDGKADVLNVKCDPMLISSLRSKKGFYPAYHMNKEKWISILLEEPDTNEMIERLLDFSYGLTQVKKRKSKEG